ncbi:hypothetical protein OK074_2085 [Actinobacteria bacterium OK074]|nr:hypothetical protein OK074_2085 [Actinobacteria bacterium OK074]
MDQPTREELLRAEAAKYGIDPAVIDRAVKVITAVQRRDRADYRKNFGGELTPDRWFAEYGQSGFEQLCADAARTAGLGDNGDLILRIVSAVAPGLEPRKDDRPLQFWARPLTDPREATFPAYRVMYEDSTLTSGSTGFDWSGALLRQTLHTVVVRGPGAASLEENTGIIALTDGQLRGVYVARPAPGHAQPPCAHCGQWAQEHTLHERFGSCAQFTSLVSEVAAAAAV